MRFFVRLVLILPRFLMPISSAEFTLTSILEQLQPDPAPVKTDKRPQRCTGAGMIISLEVGSTPHSLIGGNKSLGNSIFKYWWSNYVVYWRPSVGWSWDGCFRLNPKLEFIHCNSEELREPIRSHTDLAKEVAKYSKSAFKVVHYDLMI